MVVLSSTTWSNVEELASSATIGVLGRGVLASAERHCFLNALNACVGFGDGTPVVASNVVVVHGSVSQGANGFFQGSMASDGIDSPVPVEGLLPFDSE